MKNFYLSLQAIYKHQCLENEGNCKKPNVTGKENFIGGQPPVMKCSSIFSFYKQVCYFSVGEEIKNRLRVR